MATLTIKDLPGLMGEYEFDFDERPFTNGELHVIKEVSGVRAGQIGDALAAGDNDLLVAFAEIVLIRHGKTVPRRMLWDAPVGSLLFEFPEEAEEGDADIPPPSVSAAENAPDSTKNTSGKPSANGSENQASTPPPTGSPLSDTTVTFDRVTSAT